MGIPKFLRTLIRRYPLIEVNLKNTSVIPPIDNLYLDINSILHLLSHSREHNLLALTIKKTNDQIFKETCDIIDQIVKFIKPKSFLMIALDGVCPIAKISNQIISRYITDLFKIQEIVDFLKELELEKINDFDGNQIFPGTEFMYKFEEHLVQFISNKKKEKENMWSNIEVLISGTNSPGEGEYKIMEQIREQKEKEKNEKNEDNEEKNENLIKYCIFSGDADFILLSLLINEPNIVILKSNTINDNKYNFECNKENNFLLFNDFIYISLLREYLNLEFHCFKNNENLTKERLYEDFVLLCLLLGNDFIPGILNLDANSQIIEFILDAYKKTLEKKISEKKADIYLTENGKINFQNFKCFINELKDYENASIVLKYEFFEAIKNKNCNCKITKSTLIDIYTSCIKDSSNKDIDFGCKNNYDKLKHVMNTNNDFNKKIYSILNETILKTDKEYNNNIQDYFFSKFEKQYKIDKYEGEKMYFKEKFGINENEKNYKEEKKAIIEHYLAGLQWILYYFKGFINWNWNYIYNYPPLIISLKNYLDNCKYLGALNEHIDNIIYENNEKGDKEGKPLHPIILQCLSFPSNIESCNLIPHSYKEQIYKMMPEYYNYKITTDNNGFPYYSQTTVVCPKLKGKKNIKDLIEFKIQDNCNNGYSKISSDKEILFNKSGDKKEYKRKRKNEIFKNDEVISDKKNNCESKKIDINFPSIYYINNSEYIERTLDKVVFKNKKCKKEKKDKNGQKDKEEITTIKIKTFFMDLSLDDNKSKKIKAFFKKENGILKILKEKIISYGYPQLKLGLIKSIFLDNKFYKIKKGNLESIPSNNNNYLEQIEKDYEYIGLKIKDIFCLIEVIPIISIDNNGLCAYDEDYKYLVPLEITSLLDNIEKDINYNKNIINCINKNSNNKYIKFLEEKKALIKNCEEKDDEKCEKNEIEKKIFFFDESLRNKKCKDKNNNSPIKKCNKTKKCRKNNNNKNYEEEFDFDTIHYKHKYSEDQFYNFC